MNRLSGRFRFKKNSSVGAADAIDDSQFLKQSFLDTGDLEILKDLSNPKCIVLGRTGAGKTALLEILREQEERVIKLDPDDLALTYISNNGVLKFFADLGVNLDIFYRLLWRHIFAVELIKTHYQITDEKANENFFKSIRDRLSKNKSKESALSYLRSWGEKFWLETDYRVSEITKKLEDELDLKARAVVGGSIPGFAANSEVNVGMARRLTEEQKAELVQRGQRVVNQVQIANLANVIRVLNEDILEDRQKKYYIAIDRLDENWINDDIRYNVIRAPLETVKVFNNEIDNAKIVVAIREDLIYRVFKFSSNPGYQEEKYRSMYLILAWTPDDLEELLDRRVNQLIEEQYTTQKITLEKLLPALVSTGKDKVKPLEYLIARTMLRPRDLIMFFNECIRVSQNEPKISKDNLLRAEEGYSFSRISALADEWKADYPNLRSLIFCLKEYPHTFTQQQMKIQFDASMLEFLTQTEINLYKNSSTFVELEDLFNRGKSVNIFETYVRVMYRVGVVGIKAESYLPIYWSWQGQPYFTVCETTSIHIHPAFWRALGVKP